MTRNPIILPTAPLPIADPAILPAQTWIANVVVPVAQNVAGGLGAFILALIAASQLAGAPLPQAAQIALIVGGLVFGIAMLIRAFRDEVAYVVGIWAARHDRRAQQALQKQIADLSAELERLRATGLLEHRYAAQQAAEQLVYDHYRAQLGASRADAMARGMTRPAWEAGSTILRKAGVLDDRRNFLAPNYTVAMSAILRHMATTTTYVRTADGDFTKL